VNKPTLKLRLDAFPFETDALFGLLILAVIMQAVMLGNALMLLFGVGSLDSSDPAAQGNELITAFLPTVVVSLTILLTVFSSAFISYRRHPSDIRSRKKIHPVGEKDEKLRARIHKLARQVNIPPPQVEMEVQGLQGADGQAFGTSSPFSIRLDGGLRTLLKIKPDMFKAVVLHEFAHIANKDIARSYFSKGIWRSVLIFLAIPFLLVIGGILIKAIFVGVLDGDLGAHLLQALPVAMQLFMAVGGMLAVTFAIWARLLKSREYYADWQAGVWGAMSGLKRIFQEQIEAEGIRKSKFSLFRLHPSGRERLNVLESPEILCKVSKAFSTLVGILLAYLLSGLFYVGFSSFLVVQEIIQAYLPRFVWFGTFAGFIMLMSWSVVGLISGTLGVQVQKQSMFDLLSGKHGSADYLKLLSPAIFFVGGMEIGFVIAPFSLLAPKSISTWLVEIFLGLPVLVLITWLYFSYVRFVSIRMFENSTGKEKPLNKSRILNLLTSTWLWLLFVPPLFSAKLITDSSLGLMLTVFLGILIGVAIFGLIGIGITWGIVNMIVNRSAPVCPTCGKMTRNRALLIAVCEHCGALLGEWLVVVQPNSEIN